MTGGIDPRRTAGAAAGRECIGRALASTAWAGSCGTAFGRAGGGGHSGSSASSSGGHSSTSSSGGGSGESLGSLVALIVIALVIWVVVRRLRNNAPSASLGGMGAMSGPAGAMSSQNTLSALGAVLGASALARAGGVGVNPASVPWRPALPAAVEAIRTEDPGFELETFLQRAEMTFFLVKRGMQRNDSAAVRPYLDDAVFTEVSRYIGQMQGQHRHALYESLNVRAVHLDSARCDAQGQSIQVHFDLVYRLKTLDDAGRLVADEGADGQHAERWTFSRAAAARTSTNGDVTASRCPACGAELRLNLDGTCSHCRASVTNGTADWVVSDVQPAPFSGHSDESQFTMAAPSVPAGVAALQADDPAFQADAFRARARQAFVTLQDAWCKQNLNAGRAFLSPGAFFTWSAQLEALAAEGRRNVMENLDVRGIDIIRVVHGRVFDDLTVRLTAAAADYDVDKNGRIVFGDRTIRPFSEDWTFQRSVGVTTSDKPGTLESTCPSCGAPVALTQIGECRYCKAAVTSGKFDWVVSRIEQEDGDAGRGDSAGGTGPEDLGAALVGGLLGSLLSARLTGGSGNDEA